MAANLSVIFQAVDNISSKLSAVASAGTQVTNEFQSVEGAANHAFSNIENQVEAAGQAITGATERTDCWTAAVGNYDKSALEAVYSTEELVEMGLKSVDALEEQEKMFELCDQSAGNLSRAIEATSDIQNELISVMEQASETASELAGNENISADAKQELERASNAAANALSELITAQNEANAAMENFDMVMTSGTTDLGELEAAAERAQHAAEGLAEANGRATDASNELAKATDSAGGELEEMAEEGSNAFDDIAETLAAVGIAASVKEIADQVYELTEAFSDAESTVIKATGASGAALDSLTESMMNVYAVSKTGSLDDTAGAIGEINTRLGMTGERLDEVTEEFLDYASITGSDVVGSVQNVTKIMNQWGVSADDLEGILDRLAYAGQISGASVDTLSNTLITGAASFKSVGLSLDNTISLLSDFELAGISSTTAITAMRTAVNNFTDDGLDAETALKDVITQIVNMDDASEATALAVDTFGSRAGQQLAAAIQSGIVSIDSFTSSLEAANGTVDSTAETAQTIGEKWEQAENNIGAAFTNTLSPALEKTSSSLADIVNRTGTFLNENPAIVKAITTVGAGLGAFVGMVSLYTAGVHLAKIATDVFSVSLNAMPVFAVIGGVAALMVGLYELSEAWEEATDATGELTFASREAEAELEELNKEYEHACEVYGQNSKEAGELALQLDELSRKYENGGETIGEFKERIEELCAFFEETRSTYDENIESIDGMYSSGISLVSELQALHGQSKLTDAELSLMNSIVNELNDTYGDLGLTVDEATGRMNYSISDLYDFVTEQADLQKSEEASQALVNALTRYDELKATKDEALSELQAAKDEYNKMETEWQGAHPILKNIADGAEMNWSSELKKAWNAWQELEEAYEGPSAEYDEVIEDIRNYCDVLGYTKEETEAFIERLEGTSDVAGEMADALSETTDETVEWTDVVSDAVSSTQEKMEALVKAYNEAYEAAYEMVTSQYSIWDNLSELYDKNGNFVDDYATSMKDLNEAIKSQTAYWTDYADNLDTLQNKYSKIDGLQELVQSMDDGSAESAAALETMANASDTELEKMVKNNEKLQEAQERTAASIAETETSFSKNLSEMQDDMEKAVEDMAEKMDMGSEAKSAAIKTIQGYVDGINSMKASAVSAADAVSQAVSAALSSTSTMTTTTTPMPATTPTPVNGHAAGTTYSEPVYIAGEEGPELIISGGGDTVFPAEETNKILTAMNDNPTITEGTYSSRSNYALNTDSSDNNTEATDKTITLKIEGSGSIDVGNGVSAETVWDNVKENIKSTFMSILREEIFEEGAGVYEY